MTRLLPLIAATLPLDPVARRAMDETLADWRHELDAASGTWGRAVARIRGGAAVALVVMRVAVADTLTWPAWRTAALMLVMSGLLTAMNVRINASASQPPTWTFYGIVPAAMPLFLLLLCAAPPVRRADTTALLGAAVLVSGALFILGGWLVPLANQIQGDAARAWLLSQGVSPVQSPTVWELPLPAVARVALRAEWDSGMAVVRMNSLVAMSLMAPVFVWLGLSARRWATAIRRPWLGYPLSLVCATSVYFMAEELMRASVPLGDTSTFGRASVEVVAFWSHLVIAVGEAVLLTWLASPRTRVQLRHWARS